MSVVATQDFTAEQKRYLEGFMSGVKARGVTFADLGAPKEEIPEDETKEERIKRELNPFEAYPQLVEDAKANRAPQPENVFRYKYNGIFWLSPVHEAYMCRLRIPGGRVHSHQLRELAAISRELTTEYIQITTRNNFQLRNFEPKVAPELLRRIQSVGLHSRGAGADNIRNITANPTAGFDPHELIDVMPLVNELAQVIISTSEFYDLPRKFNIAYDGGNVISSVEDTNDIGSTAYQLGENDLGLEPGVYFRIALGGVTGHKTFARDWGVLVSPEKLNAVIFAILRVFQKHGDRSSRRKARLKYLIEDWGLDKFRDEVEKVWGETFTQVPVDHPALTRPDHSQVAHGHVGAYPQQEEGLFYVGATVPVGEMTPQQLIQVAELADRYGTGEIRLTVWQNFLIPNVPEASVSPLCQELDQIGFPTEANPLTSGFVACTGNQHCKFSSTNTKGHAVQLMQTLSKRVEMDSPINIHLTGCPNSCAQHYMGDIGLLGAKVKVGEESVEGYHVTIGGGFGKRQEVGRELFKNIAFDAMPDLLENVIKGYQQHRENEETFQSFCLRHDVDALQTIFTKDE
ncbi:MAG: NirA family protein [Verrucomicrobiota bacterium]